MKSHEEVSMKKAITPQVSDWSADVRVPAGGVTLNGELILPQGARGVVIFAHGSGSSRHSPRNQFVARILRASGVGTLLFDLLTTEEESVDEFTRHLRFEIGLLAERLVDATRWLSEEGGRIIEQARPDHLRPGYFGASTGGGAALVAAASLGEQVGAVVSRGGRPDLAGPALVQVQSPTLLIVGGLDEPVIALNQKAYDMLRCEKRVEIVPGATHLFDEPGTLDEVALLAAEWFKRHLQPQ
jgi:putative phosphoribosyl transferase